jgi:hypothetical protein
MNSPKKIISLSLVCLLMPSFAFAQDKSKEPQPASSPAPSQPLTPKPLLEFGLTEDTPVKLKLTRTMSSKDAKVGEKVDFEVLEDIKVKDTVVIRQGALAIATVTKAQPKRSMGRSGKLDINIDYVQLVDGEKVPLRASKGGSGGSRTGVMTGAMVATGILFFPAAPLFLFLKGKNIEVPQGSEVTAYVAGDTPLDPARFPATTASAVEAPLAGTEVNSSVTIKSDPDSAEITVDDKFVGTTPSTIKLSPGEHRVVVSKAGFKPWERSMTVNPNGNINLMAGLERIP